MRVFTLTTDFHNEHHSENDGVSAKSYISLAEAQKAMRNAFIEFLDGDYSGKLEDYFTEDYNPDSPNENVISDTIARACVGLDHREWNIHFDEI